MVQGLPQMYWVDQGCSSLVLLIKLVDAFACEHEGCDLTFIETDAGQIAAAGQQERT